jgi:hypothetical protein
MIMNSPVKRLYTVPVTSTQFDLGGPYMLAGAIRYCYQIDGANRRSGIQFNRVFASRRYSEKTCKVWYIEVAYDSLVEIENSDWVEELQADTSETQFRLGQKWEMHHYLIYLDSFGSFEAVAESWEVLPEVGGLWPSPSTI